MTAVISLLDITKMDFSSIISLLTSGFDLDTYLANMSSQYEGSLDGAEGSDFDISGFDLGSIFANCDYSSLDAIVINLSGLLDSLDIDLAEFGVDMSDYDLSAISVSDFIDALKDSDFVGSAFTAGSKLLSLDFDKIDLSGLIVSFDADNFDISGLLNSLNLSELDAASILNLIKSLVNMDLDGIFENGDYSSLEAIVIDLPKFLGSLGIDLAALGIDFAALGIDLSEYDLSAISLADLIGILSNINLDMETIAPILKQFGINLDEIDLSGLIAIFDEDNFDINSLLESLNLSGVDVSSILNLINSLADIDWAGIFENCDLSCLDAIVLDLSGLIDSIGMDLSALGIDESKIDFSAIALSDLIGILSNFDFDMTTIDAILKSFGIDLDKIDWSGLVTSFDEDSFDMSSLLASLDLSELDISAIVDMFNDSDVDWAGIFENADYSCFDAIVLDLTGLLDSEGMDLSALGIDESQLDLSAIRASDLIGIFTNSEFDMSMFDLSAIDFESLDVSDLLVSFDEDKFDIAGLLESLDLSELDVSAVIDMFTNSDVDLAGVFENADYSCFDAIVLDLSSLIDSLGIDLAALGIDESQLDFSAIRVSDLIGILSNFDLNMDTVAAILKSFGIDLANIDWSGILVSFDEDKFDITGLLESLNLSDLDVSAILDLLISLVEIDWAGIFENGDFSCFDAIVLDLSGLIDPLGIDLAALGIDESEYDFSAIKLSDLLTIVTNFNFDMETITALLKSFGIDLDAIDWEALMASFNDENFDMSALLDSIDLAGLDISSIPELINSLGDINWAGIFENGDFSCFDAIVLDLSGLLDSLDIDLADFDIDVSEYDLSAIKLSDLIDALCKSEFIMTAINAILKLCDIDWDNLDWSGLIVSFDEDNFDISGLLGSLNLPWDISGILQMFDENGFDLSEFMNNTLSMFMVETVAE